jgi:hypothetical protein
MLNLRPAGLVSTLANAAYSDGSMTLEKGIQTIFKSGEHTFIWMAAEPADAAKPQLAGFSRGRPPCCWKRLATPSQIH